MKKKDIEFVIKADKIVVSPTNGTRISTVFETDRYDVGSFVQSNTSKHTTYVGVTTGYVLAYINDAISKGYKVRVEKKASPQTYEVRYKEYYKTDLKHISGSSPEFKKASPMSSGEMRSARLMRGFRKPGSRWPESTQSQTNTKEKTAQETTSKPKTPEPKSASKPKTPEPKSASKPKTPEPKSASKPKTTSKKTSQKKVSIKGKPGYSLVIKTKKGYCVGPTKQTYWKKR